MREVMNGEWFISMTGSGPMVHARLLAGGENSGKLVTLVRGEAKRIAREQGIATIIIDGAPGIGCPVIASVTGADAVLAVSEPTKPGLHDLERVVEMSRHFGAEIMVAVNRYDINPEITRRIEEYTEREDLFFAGRIRYDTDVTRAQIAGGSVVEYSDGPASKDMRELWDRVSRRVVLEVE
jgi:MinD superfamily P-loop ATPase